MNLPYDIARCEGVTDVLCKFCRRTEPGNPTRQVYIAPALTFDDCPNYIEPTRPAKPAKARRKEQA